jgi:hypothetical protein
MARARSESRNRRLARAGTLRIGPCCLPVRAPRCPCFSISSWTLEEDRSPNSLFAVPACRPAPTKREEDRSLRRLCASPVHRVNNRNVHRSGSLSDVRTARACTGRASFGLGAPGPSWRFFASRVTDAPKSAGPTRTCRAQAFFFGLGIGLGTRLQTASRARAGRAFDASMKLGNVQ